MVIKKTAFFLRLMTFIILLNNASDIHSQSIPEQTGYVNDFACVLRDSTKQKLEIYLYDLWITTGAEVVVLTVKDLEGLNEYVYIRNIFQRWSIGTKKNKDGALVLLAMKERRALIEVGSGLSPVIPMKMTQHVLNKVMIPILKQNKYDEGITEGILSISTLIKVARGSITGQIDTITPGFRQY